jgi:hypothetical protein
MSVIEGNSSLLIPFSRFKFSVTLSPEKIELVDLNSNQQVKATSLNRKGIWKRPSKEK